MLFQPCMVFYFEKKLLLNTIKINGVQCCFDPNMHQKIITLCSAEESVRHVCNDKGVSKYSGKNVNLE